MARPLGRDRLAVLERERLGDEALEAEAVDLEVGGVRHRGQQVDVEVVDAVRGHRQVRGLGEARDLEPDRDAAAVREVGLREGHAAGARSARWNSWMRVQVLAGRDRQPALAHDPRVARARRPGSSAPRARRRRGRRTRAPRGSPGRRVQRMLASTISGTSGPSSSRIAATRADVLGQALAARPSS